jgi:hypothetical protein
MRAKIVGAVVLFLAGGVFGAIVTTSNSTGESPSAPRPTVTETVTVEVTKEVLTPECSGALRQAQVVLDAGLALSASEVGLGQIISDAKRYISLHDVAALSQVQANMKAYEEANAESYHTLGIETNTLEEAINTCNTN